MKTISFSELVSKVTKSFELNDFNTLVWTGLLIEEETYEVTLNDITEWFKEINLIPRDSVISEIVNITGNVRESTGDYRVDKLIKFESPTNINPLVRLNISGLKWTSDFIVNYKEDYIS